MLGLGAVASAAAPAHRLDGVTCHMSQRERGGLLSLTRPWVVRCDCCLPVGVCVLAGQSLFPDVVQALKALNISLMGAPWQPGDSVVQVGREGGSRTTHLHHHMQHHLHHHHPPTRAPCG